ncbi:MAG: amidophosphoribosyltransferase, partial [Candidatus Altiarchaeales archaeon]|nr:amidophosphoribosyltransferase [Candidatus Altiarchaeales archaeon]
MNRKIRESCGVLGIKTPGHDVFPDLYNGLYTLQHRGQESAGIATLTDGCINVHRDMGLVSPVFKDVYLEGDIGVGHVLYNNTGGSCLENTQPFVVNHSRVSFAVSHNGNLVNTCQLRDQLESKGNIFTSTSDTEVISQLIAREKVRTKDLISALKNTMNYLIGSYSLVLMAGGGRLVAVRDPHGIRPLCLGSTGEGYIVSSESCVFDVLGYEYVRDIRPSEILLIDSKNRLHSEYGPPPKPRHCMFEYVYFSRPDSVIDGVSIYDVRLRLGQILARDQPAEADLVIAVPDSGVNHAIGYARGSKIPYGEGLIKNRYIGRTFILPAEQKRDKKVKLKLNTLKTQVKDKKIVLVDDSIVRGTTMRQLVGILKKAEAREVHVRISCPPLRHPCYYGIDMQSYKEFIADKKT